MSLNCVAGRVFRGLDRFGANAYARSRMEIGAEILER
jgi:hypothetical protein